jgi:hypothetical protein
MVLPILELHPTGYKPFAAGANEYDPRTTCEPMKGTTTTREDAWPTPPPPGFQNPKAIDKETLRNLVVFLQGELVLLKVRPPL